MSRSWDLMDGMFECEVWKLVDDLNEVADSHGLIVVLGPSTWRFCQRVVGWVGRFCVLFLVVCCLCLPFLFYFVFRA